MKYTWMICSSMLIMEMHIKTIGFLNLFKIRICDFTHKYKFLLSIIFEWTRGPLTQHIPGLFCTGLPLTQDIKIP